MDRNTGVQLLVVYSVQLILRGPHRSSGEKDARLNGAKSTKSCKGSSPERLVNLCKVEYVRVDPGRPRVACQIVN